MMKLLSKFISIVLHPVFMPLAGTILIFHSGTYLSIMDKGLIRIIYIFIGLLTCVLPLSLIPLFIQMNVVGSIQMNEKKERVIPYFITFVLYYAAHILMNRIRVNSYFSTFLLSASVLVFILLIVSYFWKISSHMAGIGGLIGLVLSISFEFKSDLMVYLIILIFISGLLASARLKLKSHSAAQVYSGFLTGIIVVFYTIHIMYKA